MKGSFLLTICFVLYFKCSAQVVLDTMQYGVDCVIAFRYDSLRSTLGHRADSSLNFDHPWDSIYYNFSHSADSLQKHYNDAISAIDTKTAFLQHSIDSLARLDLPSNHPTKTLDSLNRARESITSRYESRLSALKSKTTAKLNSLSLPPEYRTPLEAMTQKINSICTDTKIIDVPKLNVPYNDISQLQSLSDLTTKAGGIGNIHNVGDLPKIDTQIADASDISQQLKAYQDDIRDVTSGNIQDMQKLPQTIEQQTSKLDGMDELQKQSGVVDQHKTALTELYDPQKAKEKAVAMARKAAVDHLAGKEEELKAAMEKISEYKQKYTSAPSIKDLPKRPPNAMKGKPFIERIVPGFYLQYQRKDLSLLDVNPYVGYKLSGKSTTGIGWNQRLAYDRRSRSFNSSTRIFGPRGFVDFKLGKGFVAHVEGEWMNSFVPSTITGNPDTGRREWVFSLMTGLKKDYRITNNLKGTAPIQYNLIDRHYTTPYVDRLNSRIGFEYIVRRKTKKAGD